MKRYFDASFDEETIRIAVVEAADEDDIREAPEARHAEIAEADLPAYFADWKRYTAHAYRDAVVEILSRDGG